MSKKQAFITISISVCFLTGIIYFSLLELKESACLESFYLRSAYLERECTGSYDMIHPALEKYERKV